MRLQHFLRAVFRLSTEHSLAHGFLKFYLDRIHSGGFHSTGRYPARSRDALSCDGDSGGHGDAPQPVPPLEHRADPADRSDQIGRAHV